MSKWSRGNLRPIKSLNLLSYREIQGLMSSQSEVRKLFRECSLAVLNSGSTEDDVNKLLEAYEDFEICLLYTSPSPRDRQKSRMPSSA